MKIGDVDVSSAILNLQHDVSILKQYINFLVKENPDLKSPTVNDMKKFREVSIKKLKSRYPTMKIK